MDLVLLRRGNKPCKLVEFVLRAVQKPQENCGQQKQIDPWIVRQVHKCLQYGALLVTRSVDHKVVSLEVFLLCPLHRFHKYEQM